MKKLRILFHMPNETIYANRTIYNGYKNAFGSMGHEFFTLTSDNNLRDMLGKIRPHIFMTSSHNYYLKFLDLDLLMNYRRRGMVMFTKIDFWSSPLKWYQINESRSLKDEPKKITMIRNGLLGDVFYHTVERDDERMRGFREATGRKFETIILAADKTLMRPEFDRRFEADISYVGTNLPRKRKDFKKLLFPLAKMYKLRLYGQDWTFREKILGLIQKFGQYFNIGFLKRIQKPKLSLDDERKIYSSSKICVNIHEDHQKKFVGDMNERFFKIMACKGFQITDFVPSMSRYFKQNEVVWVRNKKEWFQKIEYYMAHPEERKKISERGYKKVIKYHTYRNRVRRIISIYNKIKNK